MWESEDAVRRGGAVGEGQAERKQRERESRETMVDGRNKYNQFRSRRTDRLLLLLVNLRRDRDNNNNVFGSVGRSVPVTVTVTVTGDHALVFLGSYCKDPRCFVYTAQIIPYSSTSHCYRHFATPSHPSAPFDDSLPTPLILSHIFVHTRPVLGQPTFNNPPPTSK